MDPDKDNANPTVLDPSDLPSRHRAAAAPQRADGATGLFEQLLPRRSASASASASYLMSDPFERPLSSLSGSVQAEDDAADLDDVLEAIDEQEIYDLISDISDPEHPLSLGSLAVVNLSDISISPPSSPRSRISTVHVAITPTISHCSLATVIGLGVRVRLEEALPPRFRIEVRIKPGTHATGEAVTKQLADKERVAAAMENGTLTGVVRKMLETCR